MKRRESRRRRDRRRIRAVKRLRRMLCMVLAVLVFAVVGIVRVIVNVNQKTPADASKDERDVQQEVVASAEREVMASETLTSEGGIITTGISGVVNGIYGTEMPDHPIRKIGTSYEAVIVGQRSSEAMGIGTMSAGDSMQASVANLSYFSQSQASSSTVMSDVDYETLLSIVEAEAGGEDMRSRILVAEVIMNRVNDPRFPDTVSEVVWEQNNGAAQFSPTEDGRINTVEISDMTKEAVRQVLDGMADQSEGALFFVAKDQALESNVAWFESDLKQLFVHGDHAFYTFP